MAIQQIAYRGGLRVNPHTTEKLEYSLKAQSFTRLDTRRGVLAYPGSNGPQYCAVDLLAEALVSLLSPAVPPTLWSVCDIRCQGEIRFAPFFFQ